MTEPKKRTRRKALVGVVVSNKMQKTVVVMVERLVRHEAYSKMVRCRTKVKAHDEDNRCGMGDRVAIEEARPMSKEKHWRVTEILEKAAV
ncbi:30S ribosomal protein S17 [Candidatus Methylomirabilis lanthanidiphila]|uniref:Small ribosomal subunit protein uS17 n=1 Tax=Candidatus Methylomirabilis lanthanidiphila TaxID=2211376 RepID=A0A564ZGF8_9BACT|nr:30S ribosomal protein S17 [Candidatus Methylomirabilis lanthanidiphila]VUZ84410.1 30S ribosomal protein S17 [Candidatus Methylomirabilis lanthanidiphila]